MLNKRLAPAIRVALVSNKNLTGSAPEADDKLEGCSF